MALFKLMKLNSVEWDEMIVNGEYVRICEDGVTYFEVRESIQKFPNWVDNERSNNDNKHSLRNNTKFYGGRIY